MATTKKGSQQTTKAPVMMANVFAAFLSRFASAGTFFLRGATGRGDVSNVGGSGSKPLWQEVFSGDVFDELAFVNAVVFVVVVVSVKNKSQLYLLMMSNSLLEKNRIK